MDRLIWTAWRAFWVGLGASSVLIAQSLLTPQAPVPSPSTWDEPSAVPAPLHKSAEPILSRNPFDSKYRRGTS